MPPHDCNESLGVLGPDAVAAVGWPDLFLMRVSRKAISVVSRFCKWLVAPEMPTYDGTTHVILNCELFRRSSVCGSGLDGHSIHAIFWLFVLNATRFTLRVRSVRSGKFNIADSIRSDS